MNIKACTSIVRDVNESNLDYPYVSTLHGLFEAQVKKTPQHIALVYEGQTLTYQALDEASNQLARVIHKQHKDFSSDTLVMLCLERSLEMIIAILGVLKAGGAYVPIDPRYPRERIKYILEDTQSDLVLTQKSLAALFDAQQSHVLLLDDDLYHTESNQALGAHS
ncbi:MAG: AMP-binding protein, partial [Legionellaceae bacterium]|nr:AMP-binding protein [Legionellaceae bacterium]